MLYEDFWHYITWFFGLWMSYRELINAESCQEIKFKQYGQSWFCLFIALSIFAGRMISNRLARDRMDYYHVEFIWQGRVMVCLASFTVLTVCLAAVLPLKLTVRHTNCISLKCTSPYRHPFTPTASFKKRSLCKRFRMESAELKNRI